METELIITNSNTKFNNNYIHAIFSHMQIKHLEGTPGIFKYVCYLAAGSHGHAWDDEFEEDRIDGHTVGRDHTT